MAASIPGSSQDYLQERVDRMEEELVDENTVDVPVGATVYRPSADVQFARDRLGVLLGQIRKGEIAANVPKAPKAKIEEEESERRGPGRPRKATKDVRHVIFELRGKGFSLRDTDGIESVFSLCRIWYNSKKDDKQIRDRLLRERELRDEEERAAQYDDSLDLLATKEIHALPRPRSPIDMKLWPERSERLDSQIKVEDETMDMDQIRDQYQSHWRNVKKDWCAHQREVGQRFYRSINLLETVHGIAQQNSL